MSGSEKAPGAPAENSSSRTRVNGELTIGNNQDFEQLWWRLEVGVWSFLAVWLACALSGILGRGPLAHREAATRDGALMVRFEHIARYKTPAVMQVRVMPALYRDGMARIWINRVIVEQLGIERPTPQPLAAAAGEDGISYTFATGNPNAPTIVEFALEPQAAGVFHQEVRADAAHDIRMDAITLP